MISLLEGWTPRLVPLAPQAVVARGADAFALARRLLDRSDEPTLECRGAVSSGDEAVLAILGVFEHLPWADGAIYLGHDEAAPTLLWPVHLAPPCAPALLETALRRRFGSLASPLALIPDWKLVLPLGQALSVRRDLVARFLEKESDIKSL